MSYIEEIRRKGRKANPFLSLMGIELGSFGDGQAVLTMEVRSDMLNSAGWLQGGLLTAICDEAMALALFTSLEENENIATISESTTFLQGVNKGKITAVGRVIKKGHHVAFAEGNVKTSEDGTLLSQTRASFVVMKQNGKNR
ncbi:MAG: PaaI family thioesterase [Methanothrix sp.]|nr:PaaI family thioesterase [Methanothrix sp.]